MGVEGHYARSGSAESIGTWARRTIEPAKVAKIATMSVTGALGALLGVGLAFLAYSRAPQLKAAFIALTKATKIPAIGKLGPILAFVVPAAAGGIWGAAVGSFAINAVTLGRTVAAWQEGSEAYLRGDSSEGELYPGYIREEHEGLSRDEVPEEGS